MSDPFERSHHPVIGEPLDLEPGLRVVTAPNAGPMTFTGTQTYLLGTETLAVIDPGPQSDIHLGALVRAIDGHPVSHIIVTHSHVDHSPLSRRLAKITGAPVLAFGSAHEARSAVMERLANAGDLGGSEGIDTAFRCDWKIADQTEISGDGWNLRAIHTPGHLSNHLCLAWKDSGAVFSGDHVMGWATTMVSPPDGDLTEFMASLQKLADRGDDRIYYPGHGAPVRDPLGMVNYQIKHRKNRETQILEALGNGAASPLELARKIYTDVDPRLIPAAARNVFAHLIDLNERGLLGPLEGISQHSRFARK